MNYFVYDPETQRKYGPASVELLRQWVKEGRVEPDTPLEEVETGNQIRAEQVLFPPAKPVLVDLPGQAQIHAGNLCLMLGVFFCCFYLIPTLLGGAAAIVYGREADRLGHPSGRHVVVTGIFLVILSLTILVTFVAAGGGIGFS
jgi:hypothetical protein